MFINLKNIEQAAQHLKQNKILAYPSETIFGIGGNAKSEEVIEKIYQIKHRDASKPFIVLVKNLAMLGQYTDSLNHSIKQCLDHFWPGPLTVVLKSHSLPKALQKSDKTAFRISPFPFIQSLFEHIDFPLISTSANISNETVASKAQAISQNLKHADLKIINYNYPQNHKNIPSTIIDICQKENKITIIREGHITKNQLNIFQTHNKQ